jgi:hypothetical protein
LEQLANRILSPLNFEQSPIGRFGQLIVELRADLPKLLLFL